MSSFTRTIQRTLERKHRKLGKGLGIHFNGRGRSLGRKNPKDKALLARTRREKTRRGEG